MEIDSQEGPLISVEEEAQKRHQTAHKDTSSTWSYTRTTESETEFTDYGVNSSSSISTLASSAHTFVQFWPSPNVDGTSGIKILPPSPKAAEEALDFSQNKIAEISQEKPFSQALFSINQGRESHFKMAENKYNNSVSYQKQETRALPPCRLNTLPANKNSLVASRVKQFEEMIHSGEERLQSSKCLQKQISETTLIKETREKAVSLGIYTGSQKDLCEKEDIESELGEATPESCKTMASIHVLEDSEQSQFSLPKSVSASKKQPLQDLEDYHHSMNSVPGTKQNQLAVMLQRDAAAAALKKHSRKKKQKQTGKKSKVWFACKLGGHCCSGSKV